MQEADPIDQAADNMQRLEEKAVAAVRAEAVKPLPTSEFCWCCKAPTAGGARWCDADCRDLWLAGV